MVSIFTNLSLTEVQRTSFLLFFKESRSYFKIMYFKFKKNDSKSRYKL